MFAGLVVTATAASAHEAEVSATVSCSTDGHYVVNFTARSWRNYTPEQDGESWRALNSKIDVLWRFPGESKTVGATGGLHRRLRSTPIRCRGSAAQIVLPITEATTVRAADPCGQRMGPEPADRPARQRRRVVARQERLHLGRPAQRLPAPNPGYTIDACAEGGILVTLTNEGGGRPAKYQVNDKQETVPAGKTKTVFYSVAENQSKLVTIELDGVILFNQNVLRDCLHPQPSVGMANTCAGGRDRHSVDQRRHRGGGDSRQRHVGHGLAGSDR